MNDDRYRLRIEAVEYVIRRLERGDLGKKEGRELYRTGQDLLAEARDILDTDDGEIEVID